MVQFVLDTDVRIRIDGIEYGEPDRACQIIVIFNALFKSCAARVGLNGGVMRFVLLDSAQNETLKSSSNFQS